MAYEQLEDFFGSRWLILSLSAVFVCYQTWIRIRYIRNKRAHGCEDPPKYPHLDPFLGYDYWKSRKVATEQSKWMATSKALFDKYGKTYEVNDLGRRLIHTMQPENIQTVWANDSDKWGLQPLRQGLGVPLFDHGINTTDGALWRKSRALTRPTFARTEVSDLAHLETLTNRLIELLPPDGEEVDLQPLFECLFLDITTGFLFGESVNTLLIGNREKLGHFIDAFSYCLRGIGDRIRLGPLRFLHMDKKWHDSIRVVHSYVDQWVDRAIENMRGVSDEEYNKRKKFVLIDEMARQTQDRAYLRSEIIAVFVPARDTTAHAVCNVIHVLARRPELYEKVRREVLSFGDQELTFELLKQMRYVQWCLKEGHRMFPISVQSNRKALEDTVLPVGGGPDGKSPIWCQKGDVVMASNWSMHQDEDVWGPDVAEFNPERWSYMKPLWTFLPFFGGPRTCPAQQMVYTQEAFILAKFARLYSKIENTDPRPWTEKQKIVYENKFGVKVKLTSASA